MTNKKLHSADVLSDLRDFWWSPDFIELMAKRWELNKVSTMLDVGCGHGHWGQLLLPYLSSNARLVGIDPEDEWIERALNRAKKRKISKQTNYISGCAEAIPFPDNHFDMVTCQTVLIHVNDVSVALKEMMRVLKPGGLLAVAEPNNLATRLIFSNLNINEDIDKVLDQIRFQMICERGREKLGRGNTFRGDIMK